MHEVLPRAADSVLVIVNGTFAAAFRKGVGGNPSDVIIFAPDVEGHQYTINGQSFAGAFYLNGVQSSPKRTLLDYDLEGRVFTVDTSIHPADRNVIPHGRLSTGYPKSIIPHRLFNVAFRDGGTPGPHASSVPGALVLEYIPTGDPLHISGPFAPIQPESFCGNPNCFFLYAGGAEDENDDFLVHARQAWRGLADHCRGLTCEIYAALRCDCDPTIPDRLHVTDRAIEGHGPGGMLENKAPNCKTPQAVLTNGTTATVTWD